MLLKMSDDKGKSHFLALPSILDEDGVKRRNKSLSRPLEGGFFIFTVWDVLALFALKQH